MLQELGLFVSSLGSVLSWPTFGFLLIGMGLGFMVGILPGLGGSTALALMLPFTFAMEPVSAFAFLLGMGAVTATTGDLTSILFGIPGEPSSAATVFDGYPMTKRGEPGRAVGIALVSSLMGALIGAFFLAFAVQIARPVVLSFGPPEFFMVAVVALSFVATLSGKAVAKGLIMACVGFLVASIGQDPGTGRMRLSFGIPYLFDGISVVPVVVGLFAVPAVLAMMSITRDANDGKSAPSIQGWTVGARDAVSRWWLIVRCSAIGIFCGMLPGVGGSSSQFIAYAHAKQTSKAPHEFGTGSIDGLVAAGSVNNAKEGGDLVPTVGFGVPGSGQMAILLSAFLITGLTPGPAMLTDHLDVTFSMVWTLVVANIIAVILCLIFLRQICGITRIPVRRLVPFLLVFIAIGSFTATNSWNDVMIMLLFGGVAVFAGRWGWPLPPLLLGLVLGPMIESNYFLSYELNDQGFGWLGRPLVLVMIGLLVLSLGVPRLKRWIDRRAQRSVSASLELDEPATTVQAADEPTAGRWRIVFSAATLLLAVLVIWQMQFAAEIPLRTKQFPLLAAIPMALLSAYQLVVELRTLLRRQPPVTHESAGVPASTPQPTTPSPCSSSASTCVGSPSACHCSPGCICW
ncbi:MAG: Tripartite tricarboxylate transporter TctA family protein [Mycobacterium sp.]|nr:Tripartite tricarboxylate transporter TctA family protein [Mycobacterium sp.]